jgi:hypothetical protein
VMCIDEMGPLSTRSCPLPYASSVLLGCTWSDPWPSRGGAKKVPSPAMEYGNRLPVLSRSARIAGAILQRIQLGVELGEEIAAGAAVLARELVGVLPQVI